MRENEVVESVGYLRDTQVIKESVIVALEQAKSLVDGLGIVGFGTVLLIGPDGRLKEVEPFANRITTAGDEYYVRRGAAGIGTPNIAQPTLMNGMKLGTGTTAASKSGAGAALVTYLSGSNKLFDTSHPAIAAVGSDSGWNLAYKVTWAAGEATNSAITEAVVVNDAATNATTTAANTLSRVVFSAKNKGADDTLAITWTHTFLGA